MKTVSPVVIVDNCEEALKFYQEVLGGEVKNLNKNEEGKTNFANLQLDNSLIIITEGGKHSVTYGGNHRINLQIDNEEEIRKVYEAFKEDGNVDSELQRTFFGALAAAVTDKFGVNWNLVYFFAN